MDYVDFLYRNVKLIEFVRVLLVKCITRYGFSDVNINTIWAIDLELVYGNPISAGYCDLAKRRNIEPMRDHPFQLTVKPY